jgi:branched-subunit amino acid transport protein
MQTKIYLVIFGMWLANYLPRMLPMVVLSKMKIPQPVIWWLGYVPVAVLAAILLPDLIMPEPEYQLSFSLQNKYLIAALPAFAVAGRTKSLVWTLLAGMLVMAQLQLI